jgi:hypothetical protein
VVMDQLIQLHKPNENNEKWEDNGLAHSSNQTPYKIPSNLCQSPNLYGLQITEQALGLPGNRGSTGVRFF